MKQIKIFSGEDLQELEDEVNEWFGKAPARFDTGTSLNIITHSKNNSLGDGQYTEYVITILYII